MRVARRYVVRGRVQGVGFRYFVVEHARLEGLVGWVANRDDGTVEAHVEGELDAVTRLERAMHRGPGGARVDTVTVDEDLPGGRFSEFVIHS